MTRITMIVAAASSVTLAAPTTSVYNDGDAGFNDLTLGGTLERAVVESRRRRCRSDPAGVAVQSAMPAEQLTLTGSVVTLEPMTLDHVPGLLAAASTPETFRYVRRPPRTFDVDGMRRYCAAQIDDPSNMPHAVRHNATGELVGATSFMALREQDRGVEIGFTWYAPAARGTAVNPECKRLLLGRAFGDDFFDAGPAIRVELKTDARNARSRAAILKLGAQFEGILRRHVIMSDGYLRDSAIYSIIADEWPAIEAGLTRRIAAHQASRSPSGCNGSDFA